MDEHDDDLELSPATQPSDATCVAAAVATGLHEIAAALERGLEGVAAAIASADPKRHATHKR
jgi:hypothetical protein